MGLAASQARLLLLTARKSDLEYRAQQITNTEMILAMQTEQIAREYSLKISNQAVFYQDPSGEQLSTCLSASTLLAMGAGNYKILEYSDGNWFEWRSDSANNTTTERLYTNDEGKTISEAIWETLPEDEKATYHASGTAQYTPANNDYNALELLECLQNGTLKIVNAAGEDVTLSGNNNFYTGYYTDDDAAAEAEYQTKTASIQVKEKRLQNELNQIETQQKACDQEIDSVKKIIEKNIERTFKVFS